MPGRDGERGGGRQGIGRGAQVHFAAHAEAQMHAPFQVLGGAGQAQAKGLQVFDGHGCATAKCS